MSDAHTSLHLPVHVKKHKFSSNRHVILYTMFFKLMWGVVLTAERCFWQVNSGSRLTVGWRSSFMREVTKARVYSFQGYSSRDACYYPLYFASGKVWHRSSSHEIQSLYSQNKNRKKSQSPSMHCSVFYLLDVTTGKPPGPNGAKQTRR